MIRSRKRGIRTQCYSPSKEEIPPFAATWVEIGGIMLRETVRQRKMKYSMVSCVHELTEKRKKCEKWVHVQREQIGGCQKQESRVDA